MLRTIFIAGLLIGSQASAAQTLYRTICQDPKDSIKSQPKCTKAKMTCPTGQTIRQVRALCESDRIQTADWNALQNVPWNNLYVTNTVTEGAYACALGGLQAKTAGLHSVASFVTTTSADMTFDCLGKHLSKFDSSCQILVEYTCE